MTAATPLCCSRRTFTDPRTGREVWQLTDWDSHQVTAYLYAQAMSGDERYLAFRSDRGGRSALYRLEIASGRVTELSGPDGCSAHGLNVHPNGRDLYYISATGRDMLAVDLHTGQRRTVAGIDPGTDWTSLGGIPGFSGDGRKVCCSWHRAETGQGPVCAGVAVAMCAGSPFAEAFRRQPGETIQHVQFCPGPGEIVTFAVWPDYQNKPTEPHARRARAWALDCVTGTARPFLVMPPGFRATHEYWDSHGRRLYFHKKTVPSWIPTWVCSIDAGGDDFREHFRSDTRRLGHSCVSRDQAWLVSDTQDPGENELHLVNLATGTSEVLCWPNASIANGGTGHVHPFFTPSGNAVVYTSDAGGTAQVYMVPLHR
jgi:hypothetical protein